jgi:hypothetical protein
MNKQTKFDKLKQAVESFIIAEATCANNKEEYKYMLKCAELESYLD